MKGELMRLERNVDSFLHAHESKEADQVEIWAFMSDLHRAVVRVREQMRNLVQLGMYYKDEKGAIENSLETIDTVIYAQLSLALAKQVPRRQ